MGQKAAVRASSLVVPTLIVVAVVLSMVIGHGGAAVAAAPGDGDAATTTEDLPPPPIGGDVGSVDTEGFYAVYRCTYDSMEIDDVGLISDIEIATVVLTDDDGVIIDELHTRFSWADGRMMFQIIEFGPESTPLELLVGQRRTGLDMVSPDLWLPLDGSSYVLTKGWSADRNNSPYAVDLEAYSDLVIEPAPVTTLEEHGWVWNVVPYVGGYTYARDEVDDDGGGPTRTTKERVGFSYTAWYHEGTGLLLATDSAKERFLFETNYERHHSSGRVVVHPLGVMYSEQCVLVDTNLNLGAPLTNVPAAGAVLDGGAPGTDATSDGREVVAGEDSAADEDGEGADGGEDSGDEDEVDPVAQAAAAGATALLAGGWLIAETVVGRRRGDESDASTVPVAPTGFVPSDMVPTEEDRYWDERNRLERAAALRAHQQFADDQWGKFTDRCRDRAAADRAAAAAERHDRQLRRTAADRLESMATDKGYRDFVDFMDRQLEAGTLPSWDQLQEMRNGIVKRVGDQAAIDKYYEKSDLRTFLEGCQDTTARGVGKIVGTAHGEILGKGAEWTVRNPLVPARIGLAIATAGKSEIVLLPFDAWDAMESAADQKMAEQNRELTYWEATKQIIKTGAWHVGGELVGDGISEISKMRGGGVAASREAAEEAADAAARRASSRAGAQTGDDFVRRVEDSLAAKRASREAGEETLEAVARRKAERMAARNRAAFEAGEPIPTAKAHRAAEQAFERGEIVGRSRPDGWVKDHAVPGEVIPRNHLHEVGIPDSKVREIGSVCREEAVTADVRTVNMDSMHGLRDGTGQPKPLPVKSKTINEIDTYLGAGEADRGSAGLFEPTMPANIDELSPELRVKITKRFNARAKDWDKMSEDPGFLESLRDKTLEVRNGVVFDVATGNPYVGDIDLVCIRDATTGKILTHGDRYDRVMARLREMGFQHGGEVTVVPDIVSSTGLRPGTPEYKAMLEKATDLRGELQGTHWAGENVVVRIGADGTNGVVRRGPLGPDINLTPGADDILVEAADSVPTPGVVAPPRSGAGSSSGVGGAVGSTIGRELEERPDA